MGCCFSTATTQKVQNPHNQHTLKNQQPHLNPTHEVAPPQPPPPSPPLEEESVKEVLSETPISKPHQVPILMAETKTQMPFVQNPVEKFEITGPLEEVSEVVVVSQLSEACSVMSESFSTATTATTATVTEKREDEATSKQRSMEGTMIHKLNQSPSRKRPHAADGNFSGGRERRVKSPATRPEPSPSPEKKVKAGLRPVRGRESGPVANRKLNAGSARVSRDSGDGSGRRSRSPSCTRTAGGTSKVGSGGGRKQAPPANVEEKEKKCESEEAGEKNDVVTPEESIENPHVSMECFIFL